MSSEGVAVPLPGTRPARRRGVSVPPPVTAAQRSVLYAVRRRGEATVSDIASALDMTRSGARQHLTGLVDAGLVEAGNAVRPPGRSGRVERVYRLAPAAEPLFPKAYGELTNQLLGYLPDDAVASAFERRRDQRIENARVRLAGKVTLRARVVELARILDEDGYFASVERLPGGGFRVAEHNCAIFAVAGEHPRACSTELEFIRALLPEAHVERVTHLLAGAHACSYDITPSSGSPEPPGSGPRSRSQGATSSGTVAGGSGTEAPAEPTPPVDRQRVGRRPLAGSSDAAERLGCR